MSAPAVALAVIMLVLDAVPAYRTPETVVLVVEALVAIRLAIVAAVALRLAMVALVAITLVLDEVPA